MIEDIILEIFGNEKPTPWQVNQAYRTAQAVEPLMGKPNARSAIKATLHYSYFDPKKAETATARILAGA